MATTDQITQAILALIEQRPDIRTVQISDVLDFEFDAVQASLKLLIAEGHITSEVIRGPNARDATIYRVTPRGLGWKAPKAATAVTQKAPERPADVAGPSPSANSLETSGIAAETGKPASLEVAQPTTHASDKPLTKIALAIKYLALNGPTNNFALRDAMNITYAPMGILRGALDKGLLTYDGQIWRLAEPDPAEIPGAEQPPVVTSKDMSGVDIDAVHRPAHYTTGGMEVIDILRAKMSPEEFRGFCKGNIIKYILRAEHKDGAQAYRKAGAYCAYLIDHVSPKNTQSN